MLSFTQPLKGMAEFEEIEKSLEKNQGIVQITGCLIITILLLASSALMCLSLVKGRSAKEILQGGEI